MLFVLRSQTFLYSEQMVQRNILSYVDKTMSLGTLQQPRCSAQFSERNIGLEL